MALACADGAEQGGFYSYEWFENLVGCHMHNAEWIVPKWQQLKAGDEVWLHPKAQPLRVLTIDPGRAIVLERCWTFVLSPLDQQTTQLIIRGRGDYNPDFKNALLNFLFRRVIFEPTHFIMERRMMMGIKERSELKTSARALTS